MPRPFTSPAAALAAAVAIAAVAVMGVEVARLAVGHWHDLTTGVEPHASARAIVGMVLGLGLCAAAPRGVTAIATARSGGDTIILGVLFPLTISAIALVTGPATPTGLALGLGFPVSLALLLFSMKDRKPKPPVVPDPRWERTTPGRVSRRRPYPYPTPLPVAAKQRHLEAVVRIRRHLIWTVPLWAVGFGGTLFMIGFGRTSRRPLSAWETSTGLATAWTAVFTAALVVSTVGVWVAAWSFHRHKRVLKAYEVQIDDTTGREVAPAEVPHRPVDARPEPRPEVAPGTVVDTSRRRKPLLVLAAACAVIATAALGVEFVWSIVREWAEWTALGRPLRAVQTTLWLALVFAAPVTAVGCLFAETSGRSTPGRGVAAIVLGIIIPLVGWATGPTTPAEWMIVVGFGASTALLAASSKSGSASTAAGPEPQIVPDPMWGNLTSIEAARRQPYPYPTPLPPVVRENHEAAFKATIGPIVWSAALTLVGIPGTLVMLGAGMNWAWDSAPTLSAVLAIAAVVALVGGVLGLRWGFDEGARHQRLLTAYGVGVNA